MPIIGSLAGASAKGLGGLGASLILVPTTLTVDYLVVAGGGGGGNDVGAGSRWWLYGGNGGGGSLQTALSLPLTLLTQ
jgi:hypothetical protein